MSLKSFYNEIKTKLETEVPELENVRLYNSQFDNENVETAFNYPVAFIEFSAIDYVDSSQQLQDINIEMTVHVGFKSYEDESVDFWDVLQNIFVSLNQYSTTTIDPLVRIREVHDLDHNNVIVWQQVWKTKIIDCDDYIKKDQQSAGAVEIVVNGDLDIDNLILRTGDGITVLKVFEDGVFKDGVFE